MLTTLQGHTAPSPLRPRPPSKTTPTLAASTEVKFVTITITTDAGEVDNQACLQSLLLGLHCKRLFDNILISASFSTQKYTFGYRVLATASVSSFCAF